LFARAAWLIGQTQAAAAELEALAPRERVAVVPNPVVPAPPVPLTGAPSAVFSGRLSAEKDLFGLLRAWGLVAAAQPEARLHIVGAGGEYRPVEAELRAEVAGDEVLRDSVSFEGWVGDVAEWLRASDVYVFPSLSEGMSNSLLEACSWRRIVVASDIEPNRAVLGDDYPLLFAAGDAEAMASAIRRAFGDPSLRRTAVSHVERRLTRFSIDRVAADIEALIYRASNDSHTRRVASTSA
jgi:glycosyltransferase involved in cell wall biosynthesis